MALSRRHFLGRAALACVACALGPKTLARAAQDMALVPGLLGSRVSPFYRALDGGQVECTLCPHACRLAPGQKGACRVRQNLGGRQHTLVYGNPCSVHLDPIEKKPFFHVLPGSRSLSLATAGCNFSCQFCQNWEISQQGPEDTLNLRLLPAEAVEQALADGAQSLASTYVEPAIFMEYMLELGAECRRRGLLKVMHSNGYINPEPLARLMEVLGAACIDLKSAREDFYRQICGGALAPVRATLRALVKAKVHTEIVHLMIPGLNDSPPETRDLVRLVRDELSPEVPLHLTRFYPRYKLLNLPPTPLETLENARRLALESGLRYVYLGNVPGHPAENTFCPSCRTTLIERFGMRTTADHLRDGKCPTCGLAIPGIWKKPVAGQA